MLQGINLQKKGIEETESEVLSARSRPHNLMIGRNSTGLYFSCKKDRIS